MRGKDAPCVRILPAVYLEYRDTAQAQFFREFCFFIYRSRVAPRHDACRERKRYGGTQRLRRRVCDLHLSGRISGWDKAEFCGKVERISGIERPQARISHRIVLVQYRGDCGDLAARLLGEHIVLIPICRDADNKLICIYVFRGKAHDLFNPIRVRNGNVRMPFHIVQLKIEAPLVVRHDAHSVAIFVYLRKVVRVFNVGGNGFGRRKTGIERRARFDGAHDPLVVPHRLIEVLQEKRKVRASARVFSFIIDIYAVKAARIHFAHDAAHMFGALRGVTKHIVYRIRICPHDGRDESHVQFLRFRAKTCPRFAVERGVEEERTVLFDTVDEWVHFRERR